jgi:ureidoglycolate lyase
MRLRVEPLTREAFAPFGDVIQVEAAQSQFAVNTGTATRFHDLARIDTLQEGGRTVVSLFRTQPRALPFVVAMLERHPLGSQAFVPLDPATRFVVVVAESEQAPPRAFLATCSQGINYRPGTWHHPLITLDVPAAYLCIDRGGTGANCDEAALTQQWVIDSAAMAGP